MDLQVLLLYRQLHAERVVWSLSEDQMKDAVINAAIALALMVGGFVAFFVALGVLVVAAEWLSDLPQDAWNWIIGIAAFLFVWFVCALCVEDWRENRKNPKPTLTCDECGEPATSIVGRYVPGASTRQSQWVRCDEHAVTGPGRLIETV